MSDEIIINEVSEIADLTLRAAQVRTVGKTPVTFLPKDTQVVDLEKYLEAPTRKRGTNLLYDLESFVQVVSDQKTTATRLYYLNGEEARKYFKAVFDDHDKEPGWRQHQATYLLIHSVEWRTWLSSNKKQMNQETFAQFIEDNLLDIAQPPGAEMLEISRTLEAKKKVSFASGVRLSNGANELTFEETISGTAGKGKFQIPELFTIGVCVFEGGDRYAVEARLRYRIQDGGHLTMWYDLVRPHKVIEDAFAQLKTKVEAQTGLKPINGSPA